MFSSRVCAWFHGWMVAVTFDRPIQLVTPAKRYQLLLFFVLYYQHEGRVNMPTVVYLVHELGVTLSQIARACLFFCFCKNEFRPPSRCPSPAGVCHFAPKCQCTFAARACSRGELSEGTQMPSLHVSWSHGFCLLSFFYLSSFGSVLTRLIGHPIHRVGSFSSGGERHSPWRGIKVQSDLWVEKRQKTNESNPHVIGLFLF